MLEQTFGRTCRYTAVEIDENVIDLAYRYEEVDEGLKQVLSYEPPSAITGSPVARMIGAAV